MGLDDSVCTSAVFQCSKVESFTWKPVICTARGVDGD